VLVVIYELNIVCGGTDVEIIDKAFGFGSINNSWLKKINKQYTSPWGGYFGLMKWGTLMKYNSYLSVMHRSTENAVINPIQKR